MKYHLNLGNLVRFRQAFLVIFITFLFVLSPSAVAHKVAFEAPVHQWIAYQASNMWPADSQHEILQYLGTWYQNYECEEEDDWSCWITGNTIVKGTHDEDKYDPLSDTPFSLLGQGAVSNFNSHYWDNDKPDLSSSGLYDYAPTYFADYWAAVKKAEFYWDGGSENYEYFVAGAGPLETTVTFPGLLNLYKQGDKQKAYYYLGRVAHLLADMGVPAHVNNDPHPILDTYESYIGFNQKYDYYRHENYTGGEIDYSLFPADCGTKDDECPWTYTWEDTTDLFKIFHYLSERADQFESNDRKGEDPIHYVGHEPTENECQWLSDELPPKVSWMCDALPGLCEWVEDRLYWCGDHDVSYFEASIHAEDLMPLTFKCMADLYKLFWTTLNPTNLKFTGTGDGRVELEWTAPTDTSSIDHYRVYYGTNPSPDDYRVAESSATTKEIDLLENDVTYHFAVSPIYGNGHEGGRTNEVYAVPKASNVPPAIQLTAPSNPNEPTQQDGYGIRWNDSDPDDDAEITFEYDQDSNYENGVSGHITTLSEDNESDYYYWDTTNVPEGSYYVVARIYDSNNPEVIRYSPGTVLVRHAIVGSDFELADVTQWEWDDDCSGNAQEFINGIPEGAETLELVLPLHNGSGGDLLFVRGTLSSSATAIDFTEGDNYVVYGDIVGGDTKIPDDDFRFRVTEPSTSNTPFTLHLEYKDSSGNNYLQDLSLPSYSFPLQGTVGPTLTAGTPQIDEPGTSGDGDGIFEGGERIGFWVPLFNTGTAACVNPRGVLDQEATWGSDVFSDLINEYPDIPASGSATSGTDYDTWEAPRDFAGCDSNQLELPFIETGRTMLNCVIDQKGI